VARSIAADPFRKGLTRPVWMLTLPQSYLPMSPPSLADHPRSSETVTMIRSFKPRPSIVHERFGDETVIVNLDSGSYYSTQGLGSVIWGLVVDGVSDADILRRIDAEFNGDGDEIARTTASFLDQLVEESLVQAEDLADGGGESASGEPLALDKTFSVPVLQKYTDMEEMLLLDPIHEVDEHGWPSARKSPDQV
jgi:hypothetical protein